MQDYCIPQDMDSTLPSPQSRQFHDGTSVLCYVSRGVVQIFPMRQHKDAERDEKSHKDELEKEAVTA